MKLNVKSLPKMRIMIKDVAPEIAGPISHITNLFLITEVLPSKQKKAKVVTLHNGGDTSDKINYRPISMSPAMSKVMERAVHLQYRVF